MHTYFGTTEFKAADVEAAHKAAADRYRLGITRTPPPNNNAPAPTPQAARTAAEDAILEAAVQVFGSRPVNAKALGHWARARENAFIDGFVLRRRIDQHSKSNQLRVEQQ